MGRTDSLQGNQDAVSEEIVSIDRSGNRVEAEGSAMSSDGRYVVFYSAANNLVAGDTNGKSDVLVRDWATGILFRASLDSSGNQGDGDSLVAAISGDGR